MVAPMEDEMTLITLTEHETGERHEARFEAVRDLGDGAVSGIAHLSLGAHGDFTVPVVMHGGRVFVYHDWRQCDDNARLIAEDPEPMGRWFDDETDQQAVWMDGKPYLFVPDHA
jgi:hypothetical protein